MCQSCAKRLLKDSKIVCPFDKKSYWYASVQAVGRDFTIQAILNAIKVKEEESQVLKTCNKHRNELLNIFCKTDNQLICQECLITSHLDHQLVSAKPLLTNHKYFETELEIQTLQQSFLTEMRTQEEKLS